MLFHRIETAKKKNSKLLKVGNALLNVECSKKTWCRKHELLWDGCEIKVVTGSVTF